MFTAAADVLRKIGEHGRIVQEFVELGDKAKVAASEAMDTEAVLGDIPDEFLDPIQVFFFSFPLHRLLEMQLFFSDNMLCKKWPSYQYFFFLKKLIHCVFLQYTLMKDPVILPSSRITIDRPVIQRHLLSDTVSSNLFYTSAK